MNDLTNERVGLIEKIRRAHKISDAVLSAMTKVAREEFLWVGDREAAYQDEPVPIAFSQTCSQPTMVALMTEALQASPGMRVLEIGTGSGYQAAILAELGLRVTTIERIGELAERARKRLKRLGYVAIETYSGDGSMGYPPASPYDRIIVTAAMPEIPPELLDQLGAKGVLVAPVGPRDTQDLIRCTRQPNGAFSRESLGPCRFVPMLGRRGFQEKPDR